MRLLFTLVVLISASLWFVSCGPDESDPSTGDNSKDRELILTHWVDNIIVPSYNNFKVKLDAMITASDAFVATPDEAKLQNLRAAWVEAYLEWQKVELFEFGVADQYGLRGYFNIYPADTVAIVSNMNNPSVNLDLPAAYSQQGFPALDYLINGTGENDSEIVAYFSTEADANKRVAYLQRLTSRMNTMLNNVISGWNGTYRSTFISKTGLDIGSSMGNAVNAYILNYERYVRSGKIGIPSGSMISGSGVLAPEKVEAYYKKDISKQLALTAHQASENFFNGVSVLTDEEGPSLKSYLDALEAKDEATGTLLSTIISNQFNVIEQKLNGLNNDFTAQIATDNSKMNATFIEMQKLVVTLKVDMTSAMSITVTYTDNDGD